MKKGKHGNSTLSSETVLEQPQAAASEISSQPGNLAVSMNWLIGIAVYFLFANMIVPYFVGSMNAATAQLLMPGMW